MTNEQAIDIIKSNWPDERYTVLKDALTLAIDALSKSDEWRVPDETTPDDALVWRRAIYGGQVYWEYWSFGRLKEYVDVVLVKENQGPPPDDWRPK